MRLVRLWGPLVSGVLAGVNGAVLSRTAAVIAILGGVAAIIGATSTLVAVVLDHRKPKSLSERQVQRLVNKAVAEALKAHGPNP